MRNKILLPIIIITMGCWVVSIYFTNSITSNLIKKNTTEISSLHKENLFLKIGTLNTQFNIILEQIKNRALGEAAVASSYAPIIKALEDANKEDIDDENSTTLKLIRNKLKEDINFSATQAAKYLEIENWRLHVHLPNSKSLARIWRKGWQTKRNGIKKDISDDLSSFRETVNIVNREKKVIKGIEVGKGGFVIRGVVPVYNKQNEHIGSVEAFYPFNEVLKGLKVPNNINFAVLMHKDLLKIATSLSKNPKVGNSFVITDTTNENLIKSLNIENISLKSLTKKSKAKVGNYQVVGTPIKDFKNKNIGVMLYVIDLTSYAKENLKIKENGEKALYNTGFTLILIAIISFIVTIITVAIIVRKITKRLQKYVKHAENISSGDFSKTIKVEYNDEITRLGHSLNTLTSSIRDIISHLKEITEQLNNASNNISGGILLLNDISNINSEEAETNTRLMNDISSNIHTLAAASEELLASINDISQNTNESTDVVEMAFNTAKDTQSLIKHLGDKSEEIGNVIQVITSIAEQTNLLALNATIEAARAGEAGKGFSVVANEVKELSQQTAKATEEITKQITSIQEYTKSSVKGVGEISEVISNVKNNSEAIAQAIDEQSATTSNISENIQGLTSSTDEISESITKVQKATKETKQTIKTNENLAIELKKITQTIKEIVSKFKV